MPPGDDSTETLIPVHVGLRRPSFAPPVIGSGGARSFAMGARDIPLLERDFDWTGHGVTPRWIGMESSDCPAALEPGIYHQSGADELKRFLAGAASRGETAVLIATVGNVNEERPRGVLTQGHATVNLPGGQRILSSAPVPLTDPPSLLLLAWRVQTTT